jgi:hypothetical protein
MPVITRRVDRVDRVDNVDKGYEDKVVCKKYKKAESRQTVLFPVSALPAFYFYQKTNLKT